LKIYGEPLTIGIRTALYFMNKTHCLSRVTS